MDLISRGEGQLATEQLAVQSHSHRPVPCVVGPAW